MLTTEKYLEALKEAIFDLKTDLRMLEGYSRFVDENTADYHDRLCGYIGQHLIDAENFVEHLEKRLEEKGNETLTVA